MINLIDLSLEQLMRAVTIKVEIKNLQNELAALTGDKAPSVLQPKTKSNGISPAGKARIAAAAKARWAKVKAAKTNNAPATQAPAKKRTLSAAVKARIALAAKARWAKAKAAGKMHL